MKFDVFGTNRTVCNRGAGIIEAGIGWSLASLGLIELSVIEVPVLYRQELDEVWYLKDQ